MFRSDEIHKLHPQMKENPELGRLAPFKILEGLYFVGTYQGSCHIIDTGDGLIMIDPGYGNTTEMIKESIREVGLKIEDIRYIVLTHWHWDHVEASDAFRNASGAKVLIGRDDAEKAAKYCTTDILIDDGDTLTLGNTTITFLHTPGHTKGTVSPFFDVVDNGVTYRVGMFGGAGVNTLHTGKFDFEGAREAYAASIERLRGERVDVFIGNHTWNNNTHVKGAKLLAGGENEFIDGEIWGKFLDSCLERLNKLIAEGK